MYPATFSQPFRNFFPYLHRTHYNSLGHSYGKTTKNAAYSTAITPEIGPKLVRRHGGFSVVMRTSLDHELECTYIILHMHVRHMRVVKRLFFAERTSTEQSKRPFCWTRFSKNRPCLWFRQKSIRRFHTDFQCRRKFVRTCTFTF